MRLHAGSHVDAPEHNVRGGTQIHQLPLELFIGDAVIADLRDKMPGRAITEKDLEKAKASRWNQRNIGPDFRSRTGALPVAKAV